MSDELISKEKILQAVKNWRGDETQTLYGQGYEDTVRDVIKLIETAIPVKGMKITANLRCSYCGAKMEGEAE